MTGTGITYLSPWGPPTKEAIAHGKRAKELDPLTRLHPVRSWAGGTTSRGAGTRRSRNASRSRRSIRTFTSRYWCLGFAYVNKGLFEEAIAAYRTRGRSWSPRTWA